MQHYCENELARESSMKDFFLGFFGLENEADQLVREFKLQFEFGLENEDTSLKSGLDIIDEDCAEAGEGS